MLADAVAAPNCLICLHCPKSLCHTEKGVDFAADFVVSMMLTSSMNPVRYLNLLIIVK